MNCEGAKGRVACEGSVADVRDGRRLRRAAKHEPFDACHNHERRARSNGVVAKIRINGSQARHRQRTGRIAEPLRIERMVCHISGGRLEILRLKHLGMSRRESPEVPPIEPGRCRRDIPKRRQWRPVGNVREYCDKALHCIVAEQVALNLICQPRFVKDGRRVWSPPDFRLRLDVEAATAAERAAVVGRQRPRRNECRDGGSGRWNHRTAGVGKSCNSIFLAIHEEIAAKMKKGR